MAASPGNRNLRLTQGRLEPRVWAFHGKLDTVVPFEETERVVTRLEGRNRNLRLSAEPDMDHSIHWQVYGGQEVYDWLLRHDRKSRR